MSEKLKVKNLLQALKRLPEPKTYGADTVNVLFEKHKYSFVKIKKEWHYVIEN